MKRLCERLAISRVGDASLGEFRSESVECCSSNPMGCCQSYDLKTPTQSTVPDPGSTFFEVDLGVDGFFERTMSEEHPKVRGSVKLTSIRKLDAEKRKNGLQMEHAPAESPVG